ncbi:hypothetical protein [Alteribacter natronophilus]|uniref:hypothetical protein n=1 Tax=Alteribacter natronophilus TaxID=2583810 RepID=UPI00110D5F76|nr:hypothetical protein [Alteribacter natronophilus]TMW71198.1 hypothetical protein FGB90_14675 [Alteribacter natronophilus]
MRFAIFLVSVFILAACTSGLRVDSSEEAHVYEMKSFNGVVDESKLVIRDEKVIDEFISAFRAANRHRGVVDMADPDYRVDLGKDSYFLWLGESAGTVMDTADTHTIYELPEGSAERLRVWLEEQVLDG